MIISFLIMYFFSVILLIICSAVLEKAKKKMPFCCSLQHENENAWHCIVLASCHSQALMYEWVCCERVCAWCPGLDWSLIQDVLLPHTTPLSVFSFNLSPIFISKTTLYYVWGFNSHKVITFCMFEVVYFLDIFIHLGWLNCFSSHRFFMYNVIPCFKHA